MSRRSVSPRVARAREPKGGFIRSVSLPEGRIEKDRYPFTIPAIASLDTLDLHPAVTLLVGENGSGKSTLVEALAVAAGFNPEGGSRNFNFATRNSESSLGQALRLIRNPQRPRTGFFLRAESFYNVSTEIERLDAEPSFGPPLTPAYGGTPLHERSHGESFRALLAHRFKGQGLYFLDEPEAALSPQATMYALHRIHELVTEGAQFVIATHSPILMSYPESYIYLMNDDGIHRQSYAELESVALMRDFLNDPKTFLNQLLQ
ncbi:MAG: AAA family ATPase [Candidatus Dormibacteraceae bacterium]